MTISFIFPGQGSQTIGMGKSMHDNFQIARQIMEMGEEALGFKISSLMFAGNSDELTRTENAQPALLLSSTMAWHVLQSEYGRPLMSLDCCGAGHSLGEYSAMVALEAMPFGDALKAVRIRGIEMQKAVPAGIGAMAAVLGLSIEKTDEVLAAIDKENHLCRIANDNCDGQIVISGHKDAVEAAIALLKAAGAKRCLMLPVSGPFHTPLMQPAADALLSTLVTIPFTEPKAPLILNTTGTPLTDFTSTHFVETLQQQMVGQVKWRQSMLTMKDELGATTYIEIGTGKVLSGLVKRTHSDASILSLQDPSDIDAVLQNFSNLCVTS